MIWISKKVLSESLLSLTIFFNLKPIPVSDYYQLLPKFEQEFNRI